jgi:phage gpG-like protein
MTPEEMLLEIRELPTRAQTFPSIEAWRSVAEILYEGFTDNFAKSAAANGTPWPPRKSTKAMNPLLILTSLLIRSVGGHAESIYEADPFSLTLGVVGQRVPYAAIHNEGTGTTPQREFMDVTELVRDNATEKYLDAYSEHLFPRVT